MSTQLIQSGGAQVISKPQIVYLDFDGEETRYNGEFLIIDRVTVENSGLTAERISNIVSLLNASYMERNVIFVTERPAWGDFSTVYVGKTSAFAEYGNFTGLAETIDSGNRNQNDNAFVNLDAAVSDQKIAATISHEVDHIVYGTTHAGEGLGQYAETVIIYNNLTYSGTVPVFLSLTHYDNDYESSQFGDNPEPVSTWNNYDKSQDVTITSGGSMYVLSGGTATNTTVDVRAVLKVFSDGQASTTIINSGGYQHVNRGAATDTVINNGWLHVENSGTADTTTINAGGSMSVNSKATATSTTINSGGTQFVESTGTAIGTTINSGGFQIVHSSGVSLDITQNGGAINARVIGNDSVTQITGTHESGSFYLSNGVASNFLLDRGELHVFSGGTATDTTINTSGWVVTNKDGIANNTIVNSGGWMAVYADSIANNATIKSGGSMIALADACLKGTFVLGGTMTVYGAVNADASGADIVFAVNERTTENSYIISNIALLSGDVNYSITVSDSQAEGSYKLAAEAFGFSRSVSVYGDNDTLLGTFTSGNSYFTSGDRTYILSNNSGNLSFSVSDIPVLELRSDLRTNLSMNGYSQIVAWDAEKGKVGYMATNGETAPPWTGIWEWGAEEAAMWKVAAVGRFSRSPLHDGILLYNGNNNTFAAWTDLGRGDYGYVSLCHVDGNFQTLTLADFDGNGLDDVIIYDEKGSFGIVSDAAVYHDVWHVEDAATNVHQVIGAGSFGNAVNDILVKKTDENAYFLWHNEDPTFATWNWSQTYIGSLEDDWAVAAIGDFQGDGVDDIIMWQKSTGNMYAWEDGKSSTQRWVGRLDASQWEVAAVGDYNGDGKEDLLLRELVSGWGGLGYWAGADASNWTDLNSRIETDMESKFAVIA